MLWPHPIPIKPEFLGDEAQELGFLKDPQVILMCRRGWEPLLWYRRLKLEETVQSLKNYNVFVDNEHEL